MKKYFKSMWPCFMIVFTLGYMLFIFEPINLFSNNINDFWFDFKTMIIPLIKFFACYFIGLISFFSILYLTKKKIFKISLVILFVTFLCTYIEGNFLASKLPTLGVQEINWSTFTIQKIISVVIWIVVAILSIIICKKKNIDSFIRTTGFISITIFVMLTTALIPNLLKEGVLDKKEVIARTSYKNLNNYSKNKNFIILLLDNIDSTDFYNSINEKDDYKESFKDFTYFHDTTSSYIYTRESIPQILSGKMYKNKGTYKNYFVDAMNNSSLFNDLQKKNYNINVYENDFPYDDSNAFKISNVINALDENKSITQNIIIRQELKYILFRYLPYPIKKYSKIETLDFNVSSSTNEDNMVFNDDDYLFYDSFTNKKIVKNNDKEFKFIHLEGAHYPFLITENLTDDEDATYYDEVLASTKITSSYIKKLKEKNIYDNSVIIIMSDHGYNADEKRNEEGLPYGRNNPIFMVKGFSEAHNKMSVSKEKISYEDLSTIYKELLVGKKASELTHKNNSVRKFYLYLWGKENHLVEYETKDHAWEFDKIYQTGKEYNSKKKE